MYEPTYPHPDNPPIWLDKWLRKKQIDQLFSLGVRAHASRIVKQNPIRRLHWTDTTLQLHIGSQQAKWHYDSETWHLSCTCGYPKAVCVHCYLAAYLFRLLCQARNWTGPESGPESGGNDHQPVTKKSKSPGVSSPELWPRTTDGRWEQQDLFPGPAGSAQDSGTGLHPAPRRLEVEVDFHYHPGQVTIRFYLFQRDRRQLLSLRQVYSLSHRLRDQTRDPAALAARENWPIADVLFIKWVTARILKAPEFRLNLNVLKLSGARFKTWQEAWKDTPDRFFERSSQKPLQTEAEKCHLHFEVFSDRELVRVAAVINLAGGGSYQFHEICQLLAEGQRQAVVEGRVLEFDPPVSWRILTEFFARKSPGIPPEHVLRYLPAIIENRFDLLRGELIIRRQRDDVPLSIKVADDGADLCLSPRIGPVAVYPDSTAPAGELRPGENGRLVITMFRARDLPALQRFLIGLPLQRAASEGVFRLPGRTEVVAEFLQQWRQLPKTIEKTFSPELKSLLEPGEVARPLLGLRLNSFYVDLQLAWQIGSRQFQDGEVAAAVRRRPPVTRTVSGHWLTVDAQVIEQKRRPFADIGFGDRDRLRLFRPDARRILQALDKQQADYCVRPADRPVLKQVLKQTEPEKMVVPDNLQPVLRGYQIKGFNFLADRLHYGIGALLADDMGLGKTLQVLALIQALQSQVAAGSFRHGRDGDKDGFFSLVVCPASVASVWLDEGMKFCPDLECLLYAGTPEQRDAILQTGKADLLIANYAVLRNDIDKLCRFRFELIVLDEAQQIKNPEAQVSMAVKRLQSRRRLALSGTPLENRLLDLWSIMDFLNPGFLATRDEFMKLYENANRAGDLGRFIAPVMLRRTKDMVAEELPPRIEEVIRLELGEQQRCFYDRILEEARQQARQTESAIEMLTLLTRLRQACCHPRLLNRQSRPQQEESAKLELLMEMIEELLAENHSILIFSQFVAMLDLIAARLRAAEIDYRTITGSTPAGKRGEIVRDFNLSKEPGVFLLSLKAAGTGLNLTKADYVFICDPWWNPAAENQAIDRTHRIGQHKTVVAYRLIAAATVEEKVMRLQRRKAELFADLTAESDTDSTAPLAGMSVGELQQLLLD